MGASEGLAVERAESMITRWASETGTFVKRVFPERQIYHRSEGQVQYISLSTRAQLLAATASAVVVGWTAYATASVFLRGHLLSAQSAETLRIKNKYERWLAEARAREASALALLQTRTTDFQQASREFERRHETLKELLEHATGDDVPGRGLRLVRSEGSDAVLMSAAAEDATPRRSRLAAITAEPANAGSDEKLSELMVEQDRMLHAAEEAAQDRVESLRAVMQLTGVSADRVLDAGARGRGGPLIDLPRSGDREFEDPFARRVARVAARVAEAERLERAIDAAPLARPVGDRRAYQTSGFGRRVDPMTGRPAQHNGLDFGAYPMAPITAVAPGRVTFAGWKGGYGRVVEIDHGHGFKTRYGHMQKTFVKPGEQVEVGQRIGGMGSTGRSTGTHLHYEVWFKGKVYDPAKFLKAGQYVQQG